jgi:hypothetical protein|eukprot:COSAG06_NODE_1073_length_10819_cov_4.311847_13_plen_155_part_00
MVHPVKERQFTLADFKKKACRCGTVSGVPPARASACRSRTRSDLASGIVVAQSELNMRSVAVYVRSHRQLAPHFFNALCNLNKFVAHETRDPHSIRLQRAAPQMTDWERFAQLEYVRMASEEDEDDGGMEVLDFLEAEEPQQANAQAGAREAPF